TPHGQAADFDAQVLSAALTLNQPLEGFFSYFSPSAPENAQAVYPPFLLVEPASITVGALKKAEADDALIVRLVESLGREVVARITFEGGEVKTIPFAPFEIKTLKLTRDGAWTAVNLIEEKL
ncbi:MAG: hypothetical protein IAE80_00655, partial [Anaerolinea sp.]|nr:hypothetical protein [Anaerolinea sp.]